MMEDVWQLLSSLAEPQRRALFAYVRAQGQPVTREEAARACGISRSLAAFHLDKLVEDGLLDAARLDPARASGRGRGRGRPPKTYQPRINEIRIVVPERRLDLLGDILLDAAATPPGGNAWQATLAAGRSRGEQLARRHRPHRRRSSRPLTALTTVLDEMGAEPRPEGADRIVLANCPFRPLTQRRPELACQIYRAVCDGLIGGLGADARTIAVPAPPRCCIAIQH